MPLALCILPPLWCQGMCCASAKHRMLHPKELLTHVEANEKLWPLHHFYFLRSHFPGVIEHLVPFIAGTVTRSIAGNAFRKAVSHKWQQGTCLTSTGSMQLNPDHFSAVETGVKSRNCLPEAIWSFAKVCSCTSFWNASCVSQTFRANLFAPLTAWTPPIVHQ